MSLLVRLKIAREKILDRHHLADDPLHYLFSGTSWTLWRAAKRSLDAASLGTVLDAGSGRGGWGRAITARGGVRESIDIAPRGEDHPSWIGDLTRMPQVPSDRFDTVVCHQVIEHVNRPALALREIYRVLKPGGKLLISAPHLSRQHELPNDYYRFTGNGLSEVLNAAGFQVDSVAHYGGLCCFIHHQVSTVALGLAGTWAPLYYACWAVNAPIALLSGLLDALIDTKGLLANGFLAVATKAPIE